MPTKTYPSSPLVPPELQRNKPQSHMANEKDPHLYNHHESGVDGVCVCASLGLEVAGVRPSAKGNWPRSPSVRHTRGGDFIGRTMVQLCLGPAGSCCPKHVRSGYQHKIAHTHLHTKTRANMRQQVRPYHCRVKMFTKQRRVSGCFCGATCAHTLHYYSTYTVMMYALDHSLLNFLRVGRSFVISVAPGREGGRAAKKFRLSNPPFFKLQNLW